MKKAIVWFRCILASVTVGALISTKVNAEEDWFDVDQGYRLVVAYGQFDDGARSLRGSLAAPLLFNAEAVVAYSEFDAKQDSENTTMFSVQTDPDKRVSAGFTFERSEASDGYQRVDYEINTLMVLGAWETELRIGRSEIDLSAAGFDDDILEQRVRELGLRETRQDQIGLSLGYYRGNWGVKLHYDDYEAERGRNPNEFDREVLLEGLSQEQRLALFRYLSELSDERPLSVLYRSVLLANYQHSQQLGVIADYTLGLDTFFWDKRANTYSFGILHVDQKFRGEQRLQAYVSGDFLVARGLSLGATISAEDQSSSVYSEVYIGYNW